VALIREAELGRQPGQVALTLAQALQRGADAEAHAEARDGVAGRRPKNATQVVRRHCQRASQVRQRVLRLGGQDLARAVRECAPRDGSAAEPARASGRVLDGWIDVVDACVEGEDRIVTFFNGSVVRELLVALDDDARRFVWSVADGPYTHHNGATQVFAEGEYTRFVWTADLLPHDLAARTSELMEVGIGVVKRTLEGRQA